MVFVFEEWAQDATPVLSGEARLFDEYTPHVEVVWDALLERTADDSLVQVILESIFSAFSALLKRMVKDHLTGGKYDLELTDDIVKETASVQKTNTISEREFAQLYRLLREKPNAMKAAKLLMPRCTSNPQELLHTRTQPSLKN